MKLEKLVNYGSREAVMTIVIILSFTGCGTLEKNIEQPVSEQNNVLNQTEKIPVIETETKQERGDEEENLESTETEEDIDLYDDVNKIPFDKIEEFFKANLK